MGGYVQASSHCAASRTPWYTQMESLVSDRSAALQNDLGPLQQTEMRWVCGPRAGPLGFASDKVKGMMNGFKQVADIGHL
jgi:hypothetical protein